MSRRDEIDRLARLLEGEDVSAGTVGEQAEREELGALATLLRDAAPEVPPMRPEFRAELRAQVVEAAREQGREAPFLTRLREGVQRFRYSTGLAGATGLASMALAGGGVAGAAEQAQPGDALYGTKLVIEDVRLSATFDRVSRGRRAMSYALDRMDEAMQAATAGDDDGAAVALRGAGDRTREGQELITEHGETGDLLDLADVVVEEEERLAAITPLLDGAALEAAEALREVLEDARGAIADALPDGVEMPEGAAPVDVTTTPPTVPADDVSTPTPPPTAGPSTTTPPSEPVIEDPTGDLPDPGLPDLPDLPVPLPDPGDGLPLPDLPDLPIEVPSQAPTGVVPDTVDGALDAVDGVLDTVEDTVDTVDDAVGGVVDTVDDTVDAVLPDPIDDVVPDVGEVLDGAGDLVDDAGSTVGGVLDAVTGNSGSGTIGGILGGG